METIVRFTKPSEKEKYEIRRNKANKNYIAKIEGKKETLCKVKAVANITCFDIAKSEFNKVKRRGK